MYLIHRFITVAIVLSGLLGSERPLRANESGAVPAKADQATSAPDPTGEITVPVASSSLTLAQATVAQPQLMGSPGQGLRIAGYACGATGVAAIAAGIIFGLKARSYSHDVENETIFNPNQDNRGKMFETLQWVGYDVGASLVVVGALLYVFGWQSASQTSVALVTTAVPGGAGLAAQGAF